MKATASFNTCLTYIDEVREAASILDEPCYFRPFIQGTKRLKISWILKLYIFQEKKEFSALSSSDCFLSLLMTAKNYCSTDPRDKIFAILGLLEALGVRPPLEPDYEIPVCGLYMQVAKTIHQYTHGLEFLNLVERNTLTVRKSNPDLPSWAPDWTAPPNRDQLLSSACYPDIANWSEDRANPRALTQSCGFTRGSTADCTFNFDEKTITVEGFVIGSIANMQQRFVDLEPDQI